ncbi:DNA mismatch repair protein MutT [Thermanaerothrix daxensis]|uniref:DNA mismatch repair protein MutT n=1 Tax=Thermanaerothrix daxensis TaxID=869279 RepID=A0A0P6Y0T1_9CHLR|nr:PTS transporter subunit IIC [Thermanaerothrix daxensis]KPL82484.1 DNA mismatch repair protein MutT [Thermanaerothrix daxensis]
MDAVLSAIKTLFDTLGATVMLPIIIFLLALILGAKPGRAFRAAVTIGVAFVGINLVIGLMWSNLTEVAQAIVKNTGVTRDVVDVGWPSAAAIAFGSSVGLWVIPLTLVVNLVLLALRLTRTLDVDVWNYWHFAFIGSLIVAGTGNLLYGLIGAALAAALALFLGDWTAKAVQKFYGLPGISIPHLTSAPIVPIAIATNWVIERIPGLRDAEWDTETIRKRLGVFGEPVILGLVIGLVLGAIAFYNAGDAMTVLAKVLGAGINLAAVMLLLPRMVAILMEGLIPISESAREFMQKRAGGDREFYIGLDSAILIGHPAAIASALVLVPIAILLSIILPGNRVILFADLAVIPFVVAMTAPVMRGNVLRIVIAGTITLAVGFYIATSMAPLFTSAAVASGFSLPEGAVQITSIADGFLWPPFLFVRTVMGLGALGLVVLAALLGVALFFFLRNTKAWEAAAGAPAEATASAD